MVSRLLNSCWIACVIIHLRLSQSATDPNQTSPSSTSLNNQIPNANTSTPNILFTYNQTNATIFRPTNTSITTVVEPLDPGKNDDASSDSANPFTSIFDDMSVETMILYLAVIILVIITCVTCLAFFIYKRKNRQLQHAKAIGARSVSSIDAGFPITPPVCESAKSTSFVVALAPATPNTAMTPSTPSNFPDKFELLNLPQQLPMQEECDEDEDHSEPAPNLPMDDIMDSETRNNIQSFVHGYHASIQHKNDNSETQELYSDATLEMESIGDNQENEELYVNKDGIENVTTTLNKTST